MKYQTKPKNKEQHKQRYQENAELHKKHKKVRHQKSQEQKKSSDKVDNFLQQVKRDPYYICTICHQSLYQRSARFLNMKKYQILISELYHPVKSFDEKLYLCETCHRHLCKNEIPCQTVCNKMYLNPIPDELKDFKKLEKVLISKRILFKKIVKHGNSNKTCA